MKEEVDCVRPNNWLFRRVRGQGMFRPLYMIDCPVGLSAAGFSIRLAPPILNCEKGCGLSSSRETQASAIELLGMHYGTSRANIGGCFREDRAGHGQVYLLVRAGHLSTVYSLWSSIH